MEDPGTYVDEGTYLGSHTPAAPLLLWLTVNADYHSGDAHEFATFLKAHKDPYGGEDDDKVAALYVLGDDGPREATWALTLPRQSMGATLTVDCAEYGVDVTKEITNWI